MFGCFRRCKYHPIMALTFRMSMKTFARFYGPAHAEPMGMLQQRLTAHLGHSLFGGLYKVRDRPLELEFNSKGISDYYSSVFGLNFRHTSTDALRTGKEEQCGVGAKPQPKRKKLKGKRAVIKWLKFFRWKKKKDYERMTPEEKIVYKLNKARRKEARLVLALQKLQPSESSDPMHDPEILTPEEHFYYLKMGHKCKNYVPIGRRGVFAGVILNMHLHWKKHQTLKVIVKTFTPDEVRDIAGELARLTGGIVLDIYDGNTIIMYRGKNYAQPPTEIMSPKITLPRIKALAKSKYRDSLRSVRMYIPRLEKGLVQTIKNAESKLSTEHHGSVFMSENQRAESEHFPKSTESMRGHFHKEREALIEHDTQRGDLSESCVTEAEFGMPSDSEALSDMFETDSDLMSDSSDEPDRALYLDKIDAVPLEDEVASADFVECLGKMPEDSKKSDGLTDDPTDSELDEVDRMFLRAASLLKKRK